MVVVFNLSSIEDKRFDTVSSIFFLSWHGKPASSYALFLITSSFIPVLAYYSFCHFLPTRGWDAPLLSIIFHSDGNCEAPLMIRN
jgi:hypothetical protein